MANNDGLNAGKHPAKSKTIHFNLAMLLLLVHPGTRVWIQDHLWVVMMGNMLLRFITKDRLSFDLPGPGPIARLLCSFLMLAFMGATCTHVKPDAELDALAAGDNTALVEGCGNQLVSGYTYCRKREGDVGDDSLYFVGPASNCLGTGSCVSFKLYFPDGSQPAYGGSIPRGQTRVGVPWKSILGKNTFQVGDRGFWPFVMWVKYIQPDGKEYQTVSQGEIRMLVVRKEYISLSNVMDDPNFVWSWSENGVPVKMTAGSRIYVGQKKP